MRFGFASGVLGLLFADFQELCSADQQKRKLLVNDNEKFMDIERDNRRHQDLLVNNDKKQRKLEQASRTTAQEEAEVNDEGTNKRDLLEQANPKSDITITSDRELGDALDVGVLGEVEIDDELEDEMDEDSRELWGSRYNGRSSNGGRSNGGRSNGSRGGKKGGSSGSGKKGGYGGFSSGKKGGYSEDFYDGGFYDGPNGGGSKGRFNGAGSKGRFNGGSNGGRRRGGNGGNGGRRGKGRRGGKGRPSNGGKGIYYIRKPTRTRGPRPRPRTPVPTYTFSPAPAYFPTPAPFPDPTPSPIASPPPTPVGTFEPTITPLPLPPTGSPFPTSTPAPGPIVNGEETLVSTTSLPASKKQSLAQCNFEKRNPGSESYNYGCFYDSNYIAALDKAYWEDGQEDCVCSTTCNQNTKQNPCCAYLCLTDQLDCGGPIATCDGFTSSDF